MNDQMKKTLFKRQSMKKTLYNRRSGAGDRSAVRSYSMARARSGSGGGSSFYGNSKSRYYSRSWSGELTL